MQVELNISNSSVPSSNRRNRSLLLALGLGSLMLVATLLVVQNQPAANNNRALFEHDDLKKLDIKSAKETLNDLLNSMSSSTSKSSTGTTTGTTTTGTTTTGTTKTGTATTGTTTTGTTTTGTTTTGTTKTGTTTTGTTTTPTTGTTTTPTTGTTKTGTTTTPTTGTTTTPTTGTTTTGTTKTGTTTTGTTTTPTTGTTTTPTTGTTTTPVTGTTTTPTTGTTTTPTTTTPTTTTTVDSSVLTYQTGQKCVNGLTAYLSGLTAAQKAELLQAHNNFRSTIALGNAPGQPGATDMLEMVWDDDVAAKAQAWADQCVFEHDTDAGMATTKFKEVGQNLDISMSSKKLTKISLTDMVKDLYDEVNLYNGKAAPVGSYVFDDGTGHYTQIAWAKSYALGCGFKVYNDNGMYSYQLTCNYGPGGNYDGEKMYTKGTFNAANCKNGASTTYAGLCKA